MITKRLNECEKEELNYKTKIQREINKCYSDCNWDKITDYFLADGDLLHSPLFKICKNFYKSNVMNFPSLKYWTIEDYFQECFLNFILTVNKQQNGIEVESKRLSSEDLNKTYYTNIDEMDFYSSVVAHCKYILLEYISMTKKDKTRMNYSSDSLEYLQEICGDGLRYMTLQEATWTPEKCEEEKTKSKRGRKKGSKNKK